MATFKDASFQLFKDLQATVQTNVASARSFEAAAQLYTTAIYEMFQKSMVLVRQFVTVPYQDLPVQNRSFVDALASSKGVSAAIRDRTLVLSLVGTNGVKPAWNDRKQSQGHVGIPLVSAAFIDAIPMMSRLLKELGVGLDWIESHDSEVVTKTTGSMAGVFFVPDATAEKDHQGRKIIAAQDFVKAYHVKSVFGFGGGYMGTHTFTVTIIFLRETIDKKQAEHFASAMAAFKAWTVDLIRSNIFA